MSKTLDLDRIRDGMLMHGYRGYSVALGMPGFILTVERMDGTEEQRRVSSAELEAFFDGLMCPGSPPLEGTGPLPLERKGG